VEEGTVIFWMRPVVTEPYVIDCDVTVNIAFGDGEFFGGKPVIPSLHQLIEFTEQTVSLFDAEIFN
jgi:hypothetical protein